MGDRNLVTVHPFSYGTCKNEHRKQNAAPESKPLIYFPLLFSG